MTEAMWLLAFGAFWIGCGVLAYGLTLGEFDKDFGHLAYGDEDKDARFARSMAMFGPIGLFVIFVWAEHRPRIWRWTPPTREEAARRFQEAYPSLFESERKKVEGR